MRLTFLGVGEAFDEDHTNISMVLETDTVDILLDCGYSVPHAYWNHGADVDAIWVSHAHADHYYGLGPLLTRMKEEGRQRPVHILTRGCIKASLERGIEQAYPGALDDAPYAIEYRVFEDDLVFDGLEIAIAPTVHAVPNKAIRIEGESTVCYSGDGEITDASAALFHGADFLVHEAYTVEEAVENHSCIADVAELKQEQDVDRAAVVHIQRDHRTEHAKRFARERDLLVPEDGDSFTV